MLALALGVLVAVSAPATTSHAILIDVGLQASSSLPAGMPGRRLGDQHPPDATLQGRVLDALGEPIVQAEVWVNDSDKIEVGRGKTDASGIYVLRRMPVEGMLEVRATAEGRIERRETVLPGIGTRVQDLRLYDATRVSGRVLDAAGAPIADADVFVVFRHSREIGFDAAARRTTSDGEGRFALDKVPFGTLLFTAAAPGYVCARQYERVAGERTVDLRLERGAGVELRLRVTGVPAATVVRVRLSPYGHYGYLPLPPSLVEGVLDGEGRWQTAGLPDVAYEVKVQAPGLRFEPPMVKVEPNAPHDVELRAVATATHMVRGRLVSGDGRPLADQRVFVHAAVFTSNVDVVSRCTTDGDGAFVLPSPVAAGAEARVSLGSGGYWVLAPPEGADGSSSLVFRVGDAPLQLRAVPAAAVVGQLVATEDKSAPGVLIQLQRESSADHWYTVARCLSDGDGRFAFRAGRPDGQTMRVLAAERGVRGVAELSLGARVDVGKVVLARCGVVQGTVRDPDGHALPGERVHLKPWDIDRACPAARGPMFEAITDRSGAYRFYDLEPGHRFLIIDRGPGESGSDVHRLEVENGVTQTIDISAAAAR